MLAVTAIRIYTGKGNDGPPTIMADIKTFDKQAGTATIEWTDKTQRELYEPYINSYTFIYDEREKPTFNQI